MYITSSSCAYFYTCLALNHVINSTDFESKANRTIAQRNAVSSKKCIIIADGQIALTATLFKTVIVVYLI